jgi:hypothetical protein
MAKEEIELEFYVYGADADEALMTADPVMDYKTIEEAKSALQKQLDDEENPLDPEEDWKIYKITVSEVKEDAAT